MACRPLPYFGPAASAILCRQLPYFGPAVATSNSASNSLLRSAVANDPLIALAASRWSSPAVSPRAAVIAR